MCVYYCRTQYKAVRVWGGEDSGGHVLREMMSRGLCGLVCPSRTSERGGEGDCVKEGGGGEVTEVGPPERTRQTVRKGPNDVWVKAPSAPNRLN